MVVANGSVQPTVGPDRVDVVDTPLRVEAAEELSEMEARLGMRENRGGVRMIFSRVAGRNGA